MAKNFLNGYKSFRIYVKKPDGSHFKRYNFSMQFQSLREYVELHYSDAVLIDGRKVQKFKWAYYFYTIDFSSHAGKDDALKIKEILNYEAAGYRIFLMPHIDAPHRIKEVITTKSSGVAKMELSMDYQRSTAHGNIGLILEYETVHPECEVDWFDTDKIQGVLTEAHMEFMPV